MLGAALAAMLSSLSLRGAAGAGLLVLALAAQVALYVLSQRLTGLWVNTWHVPEMRGATVAATAVRTLLLLVGVGFERADARGAAAAMGVVLGVAYVVYWRWAEPRLTALWTASP